MRCRYLLVPILVAGLTSSASAGIIFGKKPKVAPEIRVPELLTTVLNDGDENKRYDAVTELRNYDPKQFPQVIPTLIQVLMTDRKPAVRSEAVNTLSKLRPVSREVGEALEYARDKDPSLRVRMQARHSLLSYHWATWWAGDPGKLNPDGPPPPSTKEPPLAPVVPPPAPKPVPMPPLIPAPPTRSAPAAEPALTPPPPALRPMPGSVQPLPKGPETPPAPKPVPPTNEEKGPELGPPQ